MKPIEFKGMNGTAAKDQPPYQPLPMYRDDKYVVSCWKMSWRERAKALWTGQIWMNLLHSPDQLITPSLLDVDCPLSSGSSIAGSRAGPI